MPFRPAPIPTVFVAIGLVILFNLGFWQLRRHAESEAMAAHIQARFDTEVLGNTDLDGAPEELSWHRAELTGQFLDQPPFLITGRFEFGRPGFDVVQPYRVDGGPVVLVNRGWVPREALDGELDDIVADREVPVRGLVLALSEYEDDGAEVLPATATAPERWPPGSFVAIGHALDVAHAGLLVVAGEPLARDERKRPEPLPVTGYIPEPKASLPHLHYAGTWFLIAATMIVMWVAAGVRRARRLREG